MPVSSSQTHQFIVGAAGQLECVVETGTQPAKGWAVIAHPLPTMGGSMDNKVVTTLARALIEQDLQVVRFNFRGVGQSAGTWDEGRGEIDDLLAIIEHYRQPEQAFYLAGFSFGGYAAATAYARLPTLLRPRQLILIAPAVGRFPIQDVPCNTLVIHGEQDDVVPLADIFTWARPQTLAIHVLPGVGHFFHGQLSRLKTLIRQGIE